MKETDERIVTTVSMDAEKYKALKKRLVDEGRSFREWLDDQLDNELAREA